MKGITKKINLIIISMLIMSMVTLPQKCAAYRQHGADGAVTAGSLLEKAGIAVNVIPLEYPEGFTIGFVINGPSDSRIVIGFQDQKQTDTAVFISIDDKELVVPLSEHSAPVIVQQAGDDLLFWLCVVEAVINLVQGVELCDDNPLCIATSVISFVIAVMNCREQYGS